MPNKLKRAADDEMKNAMQQLEILNRDLQNAADEEQRQLKGSIRNEKGIKEMFGQEDADKHLPPLQVGWQ
eukprot:2702670-Amphidinium_carterae.1